MHGSPRIRAGSAMIRSKAWKPETWDQGDRSPIAQQAATVMGDPNLEPIIAESLEQNYVDELY